MKVRDLGDALGAANDERRRTLGSQEPGRFRVDVSRPAGRARRVSQAWTPGGPGVHDQGSADHHSLSGSQRRGSRQGSHQPDRNRLPATGPTQARRVGVHARTIGGHSRHPGSISKRHIPQVWDELRRKIDDVQSRLPPSVRGKSLVVDDFGDVYGVFLAITGKDSRSPSFGATWSSCAANCCWCGTSRKWICSANSRKLFSSRSRGNGWRSSASTRNRSIASYRRRTSLPMAAACA